jgi:predicted TIM-barrel fold metal-dependent hydrolase
MTQQTWSRRELIGACGALGLLSSLARSAAAGGGAIDVHHHIAPPFYIERTMARQLALAGPLVPAVAQWTPARSVETMDQNGIAASLVSISTPGIWVDGGPESRVLARRCNEYAAKMVSDHPGRFGFMAALPLPDVDGSLAELAYALDTLKADGIGLLTSYDNKWLGDPAFDAVFDELNRRGTVVFVHPTAADCCVNLVPVVKSSYIEFPFDTTRAIMNLLYGGTFTRCPRLRFIFSHGGGTLPMLNSRMKAPSLQPDFAARLPNGFEGELRRHFYDTASVTNRASFSALKEFMPLSQVLFGTDYPYGTTVSSSVAGLAGLGLTAAEMNAIRYGNARQLFARLKG